MPKYLISRDIEGAGKLTAEQLKGISATSNDVLQQMRGEGKNIQWIQSYVTDNAINCVYVAADPALVQEHAQRGGFPCTNIQQIATTIDSTTAE